PSLTPFPYTTLFRSPTRSRDRVRSRRGTRTPPSRLGRAGMPRFRSPGCLVLPSQSWKALYQVTDHQVQSFLAIGKIEPVYITWRSEEHTSELQSRGH